MRAEMIYQKIKNCLQTLRYRWPFALGPTPSPSSPMPFCCGQCGQSTQSRKPSADCGQCGQSTKGRASCIYALSTMTTTSLRGQTARVICGHCGLVHAIPYI